MSTDRELEAQPALLQLAALMQALEIPPSAGTLAPEQLAVIGKAIANQAKQATQRELPTSDSLSHAWKSGYAQAKEEDQPPTSEEVGAMASFVERVVNLNTQERKAVADKLRRLDRERQTLIINERNCWERRQEAGQRAAEAEQRAECAESALLRRGYRKSCDTPACNCGDQWNHGGHAEQRLAEFGDELRVAGIETNGVTLLNALRSLIAALAEARKDAERWKGLVALCGYWQDGSQIEVTLDQDDATRTCFIKVGNKRYSQEGCGFSAAIDAAIAREGK